MINLEKKQQFEEQGYLIVKQLFSPGEVQEWMDHISELHQKTQTGADAKVSSSGDPLQKYPRIMMPHRWDQASLNWLLDQRIAQILQELLGIEAFAVQSMIYFKPPKARGQAFHQDQYYLRVQPGTCIAAWMALDRCDEENGSLSVVPGSQNWPLLCTTKADTIQSFTDITVPLPEGTPVIPMILEPGDVLFFNGQVVHGSGPNRSQNRFRRSLIGHYVAGDAREVWKWYQPALRMDGSETGLEVSQRGGPCGRWVDLDGKPVLEESGYEELAIRSE